MVCNDGTVYADRVQALCQTGSVAPGSTAGATDGTGGVGAGPSQAGDGRSGASNGGEVEGGAAGGDAGGGDRGDAWRWSLLLVVPLRLGLGKVVDAIYVPGLLAMFKFPQSVGCIGGTPRHSLYFVGAKGGAPCSMHGGAQTSESH